MEKLGRVSRSRQYGNTLIMALTALANSMIVQSLVTVNVEVSNYIPHANASLVTLSALMFMMVHPITTIPANYILDNYSLKIGLSINCVVVIIGCLIRLLICHSFWWLLLGNLFVAVGNTFVLNSPAKYSSIWFAPNNRLLITSILIFGNVISGGFGAFLSPFFVHDKQTKQKGQQEVFNLVLFHLFLVGGIMILNLLLFGADPWSKSPFSLKRRTVSNPQQLQTNLRNPQEPYLNVFKKLFTKKLFLIPFAAVALSNSVLNNFVTNIELYLIPFGKSSKEAASASILALLGGLANTVVFSIIIRKNRQYKKGIMSMFVSCVLSLGIFVFFGLFLNISTLFWVSVVLFGVSAIPILSSIVEATCESMYPVGEATVTGLLLVGQAIVSFCLGLATTRILHQGTKTACYISFSINVVFLLLGLVCYSFADVRLYRMLDQQSKMKENLLGFIPCQEHSESRQALKQSLISVDHNNDTTSEAAAENKSSN